jgi:TRAP-type C4-dicarboxylate transport system substrate-binding protein
MKNLGMKTAIAALTVAFAGEAIATEWNVSVWGKRRAFTEHVEKLAELVSAKTNGEFTMNVSYGGLSKNRENLDGISIGAFEMAQFCAGYHPDKNRVVTV